MPELEPAMRSRRRASERLTTTITVFSARGVRVGIEYKIYLQKMICITQAFDD